MPEPEQIVAAPDYRTVAVRLNAEELEAIGVIASLLHQSRVYCGRVTMADVMRYAIRFTADDIAGHLMGGQANVEK